MVCLVHTVYGANEVGDAASGVGRLSNALTEKVVNEVNEDVLRDPAGHHEDLNEVIAKACASTRGNGDI